MLSFPAIALLALTAGAAPGQEPPPEAVPAAVAPLEVPPPASSPSVVIPPESTPFDLSPPTRKGDRAASDFDGFGMGGSGMGGMGLGGFGMGGPGMGGFGMGAAGMGGPAYGATWYPSRPVSGSAPETDFGLLRQNLSMAMPVWRDGSDFVMLSAGVRDTMFFTDVVLPDSHQPFPSELWNVTFGAMYAHKFDNGWSGGLGVNFGSASDKPFHSIDELNLGFLSFLQVPVRDDRDWWRFSLMYSPVGTLNFPIPGIAYVWNPSDTLRVSIGLPPALTWRPIEDLVINVSYMPLVTVNARATYRVAERVFLFGGFESLQEAYLLADRENLSDRFMGFEKRLIGGVRWVACKQATLELNGGWAFDRYYGVGQNQVGDLQDQVNIAPGAFVSANLRIRF
jgi:hypothetical protein